MARPLPSAARLFCPLSWLRALLLPAIALALAACPVAEAVAQYIPPAAAADSLRGLLQRRNLPDAARLRLLQDWAAALFESHRPAQAIAAAEQVVRQAQKMQDWDLAGHWFYNLFLYSERFGDNVAALKYSQQGLAFAQAHHLPYEWQFYQCLGIVATDNKDYAAGLRYMRSAYHQQLRAAAAQVSSQDKGSLLINLANTFLAVQQYDSALHYAGRALPFYQQMGDPRGLASVYSFRGRGFEATKPQTAATLDSAAANVNRGLQLFLRYNWQQYALDEAIELADIYRQQGRPAAAQQLAERALKLAQERKAPQYKTEALAQLAWAYADQGNYRASYELADQAETLRDSLFNSGKAEALAQLQVQFSVQQQQQRLQLLAEQNRVAVERNRVMAARAEAEGAHVQLLTQLNRTAAARQQMQRTRLELLTQQSRAAQAQTQTQRARLQLLTQRTRAAEATQQAQQTRLRWLATGLALLGLGLLAGWLLYVRLRRSSRLLATANRQISAAVAEKEVLIQEIHHRVKNNLQLVSSLLAWQGSLLPDPALGAALAGSRARIQSMALVHEFLYRADNLAQVRLDTYLTELLNSLHQSLTTPQCPVRLTTELAPLVMEAKDASAFGLVVNELVTNAYKHAFAQRTHGHLHVALAACPAGFQLCVLDDGRGLPAAEGLPSKPTSLGLQLVRTLAKQLKATVTATPGFPLGTRIEVTCC